MTHKDDVVYTIKEIIEQRFDEMGAHLTEIKTQVVKTNGRVNSLEHSRTQIWTAIALLLFLGGTIIFLAVEAIEEKIRKGIEQSLTQNIK
jgi:hypothetical protein